MKAAVLVLDPQLDRAAVAQHLPASIVVIGPGATRHPPVLGLITGDHPVTAADLDLLPDIRVVVRVGPDAGRLDLAALAARGIVACRAWTDVSREVSDHALACVLSHLRGLPTLMRSVRRGGWDPRLAGSLKRSSDATLGIIGGDRAAVELAVKARLLGLQVLSGDAGSGEQAMARAGAIAVPRAGLLVRADVVALLEAQPGDPPLTTLTRADLQRLRSDAALVAVGRAPAVDLDALVAQLRAGRVAAAVFDDWPAREDERLRTANLFLTPRAAWLSTASEAAVLAAAAGAVRAVLEGRRPGDCLV